MEKLSVIVPAYNESKSLSDSINKLSAALGNCALEYEIIIVDDGSTDDTSQIAETLGKQNRFVKVVHHERNKMIGAAIISGISASRFDNIIVSPVDNPLEEGQIKKYIEKSKEADIVCGYRTKREGYTFVMRVFSKIYSYMLDIIFGLHLKDYTWICLYKKRIFEKFTPVFNGIAFFPEVLIKAHLSGFTIQEMESPMQKRKSGKATVSKPARILGLFIETMKLSAEIQKNKIISNFFLTLILLCALSLRISIINFGLPSKNLALTTYNPDEPITYYTLQKWNPQKLDFHPRDGFFWGGFHLYPLAGSLGLAKVLGYVKMGNREFYINNLNEADKLYLVGRFLMILFAVASVLLIYLIGAATYGKTAGLLMAFMLAIAPAHIFSSFFVRPDIMMMFFGLFAIYFSVKLLKSGGTKFYILSCISVGFATGTKYSGAVYGVVPLLAHFLSNPPLINGKRWGFALPLLMKEKFKDIRLYFIPLICLMGFCISSPYVVIDFNRTSESFLSYLKMNFSLSQGAMDLGQLELLGYGPLSYIKNYLVYALGKIVVIGSIIGAGLMLFKTKNKFDILFLISGIIILFVVSLSKNQTVWYTFPIIPFIIIFVIRGLDIILAAKSPLIKGGRGVVASLGIISAIIVFGSTLVYSIAHWKLYYQKNVREEASEWIEKNLPKGSKVAIARSYFWTPGILRQYNPPYKLLMGGDPIYSSVDQAVFGLKKILPQTEYLVLTEYEYRQFLEPKLEKYFPEQSKIIRDIFSEKEFRKVAEFDKEAKFLGFKFKKNYPPTDWLIPNPRIIVFKKII